ncbi:ferritin [Lentisphaerota bacterium WC36G]|nr:ferritin [Lentisphaerae bacterium WC36]
MLDKQLEQALNDQINFEFYSSYLYLNMSAQLAAMNLDGAAHWMRVQAQEEVTHAMKIYDFLIDRDAEVCLQNIETIGEKYNSLVEIYEVTVGHERKVTCRFNDLIDLALEKRDHVTNSLLQWFISEQIEEEANVRTILEKAKMLSSSPDSLYLLDKELGARVASAPIAEKIN